MIHHSIMQGINAQRKQRRFAKMTTSPSNFQSCLLKQAKVKALFASCSTPEQKYMKLIELGRSLPPLNASFKTEENLVKGCQSRMYLHATVVEGKIFFQIDADALISEGLGALLLLVYQEEPPEALLSCPPTFLEELEIQKSLSPNRASGLASLFLRMKQEALKFLVI